MTKTQLARNARAKMLNAICHHAALRAAAIIHPLPVLQGVQAAEAAAAAPAIKEEICSG